MSGRGSIKSSDLVILNGIGEGDGEIKLSNGMEITKKGNLITRKWKSDNGDTNILKFDISKSRNNPISTELISVKEEVYIDEPELDNDDLPKTKRKYINPTNGKLIGYARAKNLRLI